MKKAVKNSEKKSSYNKTGLGIAGLTLAISGIFLIFFAPIVISPIFIIIALIFSLIQQIKNPTKTGKWALILSLVSIVIFVVWLIVLIKYIVPLLGNILQ